MRRRGGVVWEKVWQEWPAEPEVRRQGRPRKGEAQKILAQEAARQRRRAENVEAALVALAEEGKGRAARELYREGVSNWWIGRILGVPIGVVRRWTG